MLVVILYVFSVFLTQAVADHMHWITDEVRENFGPLDEEDDGCYCTF